MEFAPSGVKLGFEVTYDSPSLNVGITAYDVSGPTPVLFLPTTAMINVSGNTYIGYLPPLSAGKSYLIHKAVYTDNTLTTMSPDYSQGSETIQTGGVDISTVVPSVAQTNKNFTALPCMEDALFNWLQPMIFGVVIKSVVDFQVKEVATLVNFKGVWQPYSAAKMDILPIGQRTWPWFQLHTQTALGLQTDDIVTYNGVQYRVMEQSDYSPYCYYEYHLVKDWTGSGPTA